MALALIGLLTGWLPTLASSEESIIDKFWSLFGDNCYELLSSKNYEEGIPACERMANKGHAEAQYNLGVIYENGRGVKQNYDEAAKWYLKAAHNNDTLAQFNIANLYRDGQGIEQSHEEAFRWFNSAADNDYVDAQVELARWYQNGIWVDKDMNIALDFYERAANQCHALSQFNLGSSYMFGAHRNTDYEKAYAWLKLSSELGGSDAQARLELLVSKLNTAQVDAGETVYIEYAEKCTK